MNNLTLRVISGAIMIILLIALLVFASNLILLLAILLLTITASIEYKSMLANNGIKLSWYIFITPVLFSVFLLAPEYIDYGIINLTLILIFIAGLTLGLIALSKKKLTYSFNFFYLAWIFSSFVTIYLNLIYLSRYHFFLLIVCVVLTDIFAFFGGRLIGKNKLAPKISPQKTIEGSISGLLFSMIGATIFNYYYPIYTGIELILIALILSIATQVGDLLESAFKRYCAVKDSGKIIPGHGGVLDRFDGLLIASQLYFFYNMISKLLLTI